MTWQEGARGGINTRRVCYQTPILQAGQLVFFVKITVSKKREKKVPISRFQKSNRSNKKSGEAL